MIQKNYKYLHFIMAGFVTVLLCSNLIGPAKICAIELPVALPLIGSLLVFGAGNLFFPISYIFGDILTEVYGYAQARKVIWAGFAAMIFATCMSQIVIHMPGHSAEPFNATLQPALEVVFGSTWRIVIASMIAFWAGDFVNAYVLARVKVWTQGRHLWFRTISSTILGQGVDSLIFYPIAFYGTWSNEGLISVILFNFVFKVLVEVVMTPGTYFIVGRLKQLENEDHFDTETDFSPFSISDK
jgi:uncharacterized integral membrane protein (TIGR00697 family)